MAYKIRNKPTKKPRKDIKTDTYGYVQEITKGNKMLKKVMVNGKIYTFDKTSNRYINEKEGALHYGEFPTRRIR